jgi:hypothetical protein
MERSLVSKPIEEWCAYRDQFGVWQKCMTQDNWNIPDETQVRLFETEKEVDEFIKPTPQN